MITAIQESGFSAYKLSDLYICHDPTWKTITYVAGAIFASLASFYLLSIEAAFAIIFSASLITWTAFSKESVIDKAKRQHAHAEELIEFCHRDASSTEDKCALVEYLQQILNLPFQEDLLRAKTLYLLASAQRLRNLPGDLDLAIQSYSGAQLLSFQDDFLRGQVLYGLAALLLERKQPDDLALAIQNLERSAEITPAQYTHFRTLVLYNLALALIRRNQPGDLALASQYFKQPVAITSFQHMHLGALVLKNLGCAYLLKQEPDDLVLAINYLEEADALRFNDDILRAEILTFLALATKQRENQGDLVLAINYLEQALALAFQNANLRMRIQAILAAFQQE